MRQTTISVKEAGDIAYYSPKIRERKEEKDNENLVGEKYCFPQHTLRSHVRQTEQSHKGSQPSAWSLGALQAARPSFLLDWFHTFGTKKGDLAMGGPCYIRVSIPPCK